MTPERPRYTSLLSGGARNSTGLLGLISDFPLRYSLRRTNRTAVRDRKPRHWLCQSVVCGGSCRSVPRREIESAAQARRFWGLHKDQSGFTILELSVTMIVGGIVIALLTSFFTGGLQTLMGGQLRTEMERDVQLAARRVQEDIQLAARALSQNTLPDANAPGGTWNAQASNPAVLIMETLAVDSGNNIIFDVNLFNSYKNEIVYYVSGGKLYRRTIANASAPGNSAVTTCPPPGTPGCPPDNQVLDDVINFSLVHFDVTGGITVSYPETVATEATFSIRRTNFGNPITIERKLKAVQRNIQ